MGIETQAFLSLLPIIAVALFLVVLQGTTEYRDSDCHGDHQPCGDHDRACVTAFQTHDSGFTTDSRLTRRGTTGWTVALLARGTSRQTDSPA